MLTLGAGSVWTAGEELLEGGARNQAERAKADGVDAHMDRRVTGRPARGRRAVPRERAVLPPHLHGGGRAGGGDGLPALARRAAEDAARCGASSACPTASWAAARTSWSWTKASTSWWSTPRACAQVEHRRRRRRHRGRRGQPDPHGGALRPGRAGAGSRAPCGIPGSVGGAAVMNAGAYGFSISDVMKEIVVYDEDGERQQPPEGWRFHYRGSSIPEGSAVASIKVAPPRGRPRGARARRSESFSSSASGASPPAATPAASSRTRRAATAGRIIDEPRPQGHAAGRRGGEPRHANFVVNDAGRPRPGRARPPGPRARARGARGRRGAGARSEGLEAEGHEARGAGLPA